MTNNKDQFLDLVAEMDDAAADFRAAAADLLALAANADGRLRDAIATTLANRAAHVIHHGSAYTQILQSTDELLDAARLCERLGVT